MKLLQIKTMHHFNSFYYEELALYTVINEIDFIVIY